MKHFKLPLIVTGVTFFVGLITSVVLIVVILNSDLSNRKKNERASMLGSGVGTMCCVFIAPFWFYSAAKVGKQRREAKRLKEETE